MGFQRTLIPFLKLSRPHNIFITFLGVLVGAVVVDPGAFVAPSLVLLISIPALSVAAGGYIVNDYYDIEIDRRSKPWRPLVRGDISARTALAVSLGLLMLGIVISLLLLGIFVALFVAINALLTYLYSWRLKKLGLVGNICVSILSANSILYGGISYASYATMHGSTDPGSLGLVLIPWLFAFIMSLSREIIKGIEDIRGDMEQGVRTLAVVRGYAYASLVSLALLVSLLAIIALPLIYRWSAGYLALSIVSIAIFLASVVNIYLSHSVTVAIKRASISRSISKASLLLGTLAFLLWAIG